MTFGFLQIILGLVALGAMVGIYFINKKQSPQGQSMSLLLLAVFIIAGGAFLWTSNILSVIGIGQTRQEKMREDGQQFYASQAFVLGNKIGAGQKVFIIVDDTDKEALDANKSSNVVAFDEVFKETPAGADYIIDTPELSMLKNLSEDQKLARRSMAGYSMTVTPDDYNKLVDKHDPDVIIIAAGLPAGSPANIRCIKKNNKTPVYLSYKSGIRRDMAEQLVGEGYVAGAIVRTNKSQKDAVASADLQESFDQMYSYIGE